MAVYYSRFLLPVRRVLPEDLRAGDILTGSGFPKAIVAVAPYGNAMYIAQVRAGYGADELEIVQMKPNSLYEVLA